MSVNRLDLINFLNFSTFSDTTESDNRFQISHETYRHDLVGRHNLTKGIVSAREWLLRLLRLTLLVFLKIIHPGGKTRRPRRSIPISNRS